MKRRILILLILTLQLHTQAQKAESWQYVKSISGQFSFFMPDELGNLFAITANGQFKKYNAQLDSMGVLNEIKRYGKPYSMSVENPLRSLLFFKEYKTVVVLDRLMQVVGKVDLRKAGIYQTQAVGQSYDNNIWTFDEQDSKLKKISTEGKLLFETPDLRLVFSEAILPTSLFDRNGYVYLYDPAKGLFIFDYYGAFKNRIALLNWSSIQSWGKRIVGYKEGKWLSYTPGEIDIQEFMLPGSTDANPIRFIAEGFYVMDETGIHRYATKSINR
jgi:hypothetical protein